MAKHDEPHDFFPEDQRRMMAEPLPDGRFRCTPPFLDPDTFEEHEIVSLSLEELIEHGYETDDPED